MSDQTVSEERTRSTLIAATEAVRLFDPKRVDGFKAFLTACGCDVLEPTNEWEVIRFRAGRRLNVIYRSKRGDYSLVGDDITPALTSFRTGIEWRPVPRGKRKSGRRRANLIATLLKRDGEDCFFCGKPLGADITVEELIPIASGGARNLANAALAHADCNKKAGHLSVVEKVRLREQMRGGTGR